MSRVGIEPTNTASKARTGKTRYVPLNSEAANVLRAWRPEEADQGALVFPGHDGRRMKTITTAWRAVAKEAKLTGFNFHDLRHHAGSGIIGTHSPAGWSKGAWI